MSSDDSPTLGEQMNNDLYLDPGFTEDKPGLVDAVREEIDETAQRAEAKRDAERRQAEESGLADEP